MMHVALLRAVNLAGRNQVGMADLRELLTELGFDDARSLLNSGNLVFRSDRRAGTQLESLLAKEAQARLGVDTDFFVRDAREWRAVVADNPFPEEAVADPGHLLVMFLRETPGAGAVTGLQNAIPGRERVVSRGRHAYVFYPDGVGRSRLTTALIERKLGTRCTGRNWNTVLKLGALLER